MPTPDGLPTKHPLYWPFGWKRTPPGEREPGMFAYRAASSPGSSYRQLKDITVAQAVERLQGELRRMGIDVDNDVVISSNLRLRMDGLPRSDQGEPGDPGVAVYWRDAGRDRCMAIDRYTRVAQNVAALAATIEAMRAIERHGGAAILDRAFTGFTALPAPIVAGMKRPWREILGFPADYTVTADLVRERYRSRASQVHPDKGGTSQEMSELNAARDDALQELSNG